MRRLLLLLAIPVIAAASVTAQGYSAKVVGQNLNKPTGIAVAPNGLVYYTELPNPGQSGRNNSVSRLDPNTGNTTLIVGGEPAPTNISVIANGDFFWTCQTAGVIFRRSPNATSQTLVGRGLDNPVGISVTDAGTIYFTQVPTPGVPGSMNGRNTVSVINGSSVTDLSKGEPEPVDVVTDNMGNLYWTCKTAGVILRRDASTMQKSFVFMGNLNSPAGIAMDTSGCIYFTEVPTPGQPGSMGGTNAVWKFNPTTENLTLINYGDPEPVDVTVSRDGKDIYWTCRTAGVIVRAAANANPATIVRSGTTRPGDTVGLTFRSAGDANATYRAAASFGRGPIAIDTRYVPLAFDTLFIATVENRLAGITNGFAGTLDGTGAANGSVKIPNAAALVGVQFYNGFVTLSGSAPSGIQSISSANRITIG